MASAKKEEFDVPKSSWFVRLMILVVVLVLGTIGTGFAREAVDAYTLARDVGSFTSTKGEITRASVRSEGRDQVPEVKFNYKVHEKTYEGSNHYTASSYRDAKLASRDANRYKVGQTITVFYDADAPARAALSREIPLQRAYVRFAYGALFYGIAIFTIVTYIRSRKKMRVLAYAKHVERERQQILDEERATRLKSRGEEQG